MYGSRRLKESKLVDFLWFLVKIVTLTVLEPTKNLLNSFVTLSESVEGQIDITMTLLHPLITLSTAAMPPSVDSLCYKRESHQHKYIIFYFPEEEENISQHPENGNYMKDTEEKEAQELKSLDVWYNKHYSIPQTSPTEYLEKELLFTTFIPLVFYLYVYISYSTC